MFRNVVRKKQKLSEQECIEILKNEKRGVLSVIGDDGYPYGLPINHFYDERNGLIYFHSGKTGYKIDAMNSCDKVSFCVLSEGVKEENDWWYHFTSVICFGRMSEVTEQEEAYRCLRLLGRKYMPTVEMVEEDMEKNAARAAVLKLTVEHMTGKHVKEN